MNELCPPPIADNFLGGRPLNYVGLCACQLHGGALFRLLSVLRSKRHRTPSPSDPLSIFLPGFRPLCMVHVPLSYRLLAGKKESEPLSEPLYLPHLYVYLSICRPTLHVSLPTLLEPK